MSTAQEKKQRRLLFSCTLQAVLQTLNTFICKSQNQESQDCMEEVKDGYICRPCVRLMERYNKVHEEVLSSVMKALPVLRRGRPVSDITAHSDEAGASAQFSSQPDSSPASRPACSSVPVQHQQTNTDSPALTVSNFSRSIVLL